MHEDNQPTVLEILYLFSFERSFIDSFGKRVYLGHLLLFGVVFHCASNTLIYTELPCVGIATLIIALLFVCILFGGSDLREVGSWQSVWSTDSCIHVGN